MSEREQAQPGPARAPDLQEARLRAILQATYQASEPGAELEQSVRELVARHRTQERQPDRGWRGLLAWEPVGALAAAALAAALSLAPFRGVRRPADQIPGTARPDSASMRLTPHSPRSATGLWPHPSKPSASHLLLTDPRPGPAHPVRGPLVPAPARNQSRRTTGGRSAKPRPAGSLPGDRSGTGAVDDLDYLNQPLEQTVSQWVVLSPDDRDRIEAQVRNAIRVRDDFVTIPFPRLAGSSPRQVVQAVESYRREAAVVDPRLTREVTLQFKGIALADLCDHLCRETGIELSAGRSVADEKVTVFCRQTRLRDVMRQLSRPFGYAWLRSRPTDGQYRYELEQDLKSQLLEEELRNQDREATLLKLDGEMQKFRPYLGVNFADLKKQWDDLPGDKKRQPWERLNDESGVGQLWELIIGGWGAAQFYHHLTTADRSALMAGQELEFRPDAPDPERRLPAEWGRQLLLSMPLDIPVNGHPTPIAAVPGVQFGQLRLGINRSELGEVSLRFGLWATEQNSEQAGPRWGFVNVVAAARSPSAAHPNNAAANASLRGRPPFTQVVSLHPKSSCPAEAQHQAGDTALRSTDDISIDFDSSQAHVTSADVWEAVHQATGLPIVADYYTHLYPVSKLIVERQPLFRALCQVGDALDVRWWKDGDFLVGRSASYFWDRLKEVPNRYLQRWSQDRDANRGLPLADFLEMTSMSDQQLDAGAVAQGIERYLGLREWAWARDHRLRYDARGLALLTPEQLRRVQEPAGLPFRELAPAQQQGIIRLQYGRQEATRGPGEPSAPIRSPEEFARSSIRAFYLPARWYLAPVPQESQRDPGRPDPWFYAGGRTPAEAEAAARQRYPRSAPEKVRQARDGFFRAEIDFYHRGTDH